jgi:hypothetical protein
VENKDLGSDPAIGRGHEEGELEPWAELAETSGGAEREREKGKEAKRVRSERERD